MSGIKCTYSGHNTHLLISITLHIFLLFTFLSIFFWLVIRKVETTSINNELNTAIDSNIKNLNIKKRIIPDNVFNYLNKVFSQESPEVKKNNYWVFFYNISIIIFLLLTLILVIIVLKLSCGHCLSIWEIISENVFILLLVGAIEYMFFTYIASKYVPVLPSYLPTILVNDLKEKLKSPSVPVGINDNKCKLQSHYHPKHQLSGPDGCMKDSDM